MQLGPHNCKSQFAITFFRPSSFDKINELQDYLSQTSTVGEIFKNPNHPPVSKIFLPKFKVEKELNLVELLKNLGVQEVFDFSKADFSEMIVQKSQKI